MRRVLLFLALASVLLVKPAAAQTSPPSSTGGLIATIQPDNGAPTASPLRSLLPDLQPMRRWMIDLAATFQPRPALRATAKVRRTTPGRRF